MRIGVSSFVVLDEKTDTVVNEMYWPAHPLRPDGAMSLFADVPEQHWAAKMLKQMAAKLIAKGVNETDFAPNNERLAELNSQR